MAITTFSELKQALADWADVGTSLDNYLEDFITLTTDALNYGSEGMSALRMREMIEVTDLTPVSGVCTLPTDYLQYREVVELASTRRHLKYIPPSVVEQTYAYRPGGLARDFTIINGDLVMYPVSTNGIELTYYQKIPTLSDSAPTNWLLTKHPTVYLHGGLAQLALFRRDDPLLQRSASLLTSYMRGLERSGEASEFARSAVRLRQAP
jgi:hypothetical protein